MPMQVQPVVQDDHPDTPDGRRGGKDEREEHWKAILCNSSTPCSALKMYKDV